MSLRQSLLYARYYPSATLKRSPIHNFVKAVPLLLSREGKEIVFDVLRNYKRFIRIPEDPLRKKFRDHPGFTKPLTKIHDAVAISIYHKLTGVDPQKIVNSGAVDLMQLMYAHIFNMDNHLDVSPRPNLSNADTVEKLREDCINPARELFQQRVNQIFPQVGSQQRMMEMYDKFNDSVFNALRDYQRIDSPTLSQTLDHRYATVGAMAEIGVQMMHECIGGEIRNKEEAKSAFFHAVMAAQIHDDLTDVWLDDNANTNENMVLAFLRQNGEYENARPYFKIMTADVLKRFAPKTYESFQTFEKNHIAQLPTGPEFEILRKFPSVF